ncbi:MAG: hypothetical protein MAG795_00460 [Candidatus Woesearchaeota archaeon]|nr:hypothetical protein [Candidatus Woesearchaeota archaeon]
MVITAGGFKDIWKEEVAPDGTMLNIGPYKLGKDYFNVLHHQDSKWRNY